MALAVVAMGAVPVGAQAGGTVSETVSASTPDSSSPSPSDETTRGQPPSAVIDWRQALAPLPFVESGSFPAWSSVSFPTGAAPATRFGVQLDQVRLVSESGGIRLIDAFSKNWGEAVKVRLQVMTANSLTTVKVLGIVESPAVTIHSLILRFGMRGPQIVCDSDRGGAAGYACTTPYGAVASVCMSDDCDNTHHVRKNPADGAGIATLGGMTFLGFDFYFRFDGSRGLISDHRAAIFMTPQARHSISFRSALRAALGPAVLQPRSQYQPILFWVENARASKLSMSSSETLSMAEIANRRGFQELEIGGGIWSRSPGAFDPRSGFETAVTRAHRAAGTPQISLHHEISRTTADNAMTWARRAVDPSGQPICAGGDACDYKVWDASDPNFVRQVAATWVQGLRSLANAGTISGLYLDGNELLSTRGLVNPAVSHRALINTLGDGLRTVRMIGAVSGPFMIDRLYAQEISDRWQVYGSVNPAVWAAVTAVPRMTDLLRMGEIPRFGWFPVRMRSNEILPDDLEQYRWALNHAIAFGAPLTVEGTRAEFQASAAIPYLQSIEEKLKLAAIVSKSDRHVAELTGSHVRVDYEDGTSTVGLFGDRVPDLSNASTELRTYGLERSSSGALFNSQPLVPAEPTTARLKVKGTSAYAPETPALVFHNGFTIDATFEILDPTKSGMIIRKARGFSLYYWANEKRIGGALTHDDTGNIYSIYSPPVGAPHGLLAKGMNRVVLRHDPVAKTLILWVNGAEAARMSTGSVVYQPDQAATYVGAFFQSSPSGRINARISRIRIHSTALTDREVQGAPASVTRALAADWDLSRVTHSHDGRILRANKRLVLAPLNNALTGRVQIKLRARAPGSVCKIQLRGRVTSTVSATADAQSEVTVPHDLKPGASDLQLFEILSCT